MTYRNIHINHALMFNLILLICLSNKSYNKNKLSENRKMNKKIELKNGFASFFNTKTVSDIK